MQDITIQAGNKLEEANEKYIDIYINLYTKSSQRSQRDWFTYSDK